MFAEDVVRGCLSQTEGDILYLLLRVESEHHVFHKCQLAAAAVVGKRHLQAAGHNAPVLCSLEKSDVGGSHHTCRPHLQQCTIARQTAVYGEVPIHGTKAACTGGLHHLGHNLGIVFSLCLHLAHVWSQVHARLLLGGSDFIG